MTALAYKPLRDVVGVWTAHSGRVRVGYVARLHSGRWRWELTMVSEQWRGHPRGDVDEKAQAHAALQETWDGWVRGAGLTDAA